jgi:thiamine transport system substrate-binding protein
MKKISAIAVSVLLFAACSGSADNDSSQSDGPVTLTLLAHDSFTPSEGIFDAFTAATGISVNVVRSGDAGELITKAALTAGNPEGDVLWGVDNTLLSRALDADMFASYETTNLASMNESVLQNIPGHEVTPVDTGDVCINYDIAWFKDNNIAPPMTLDALVSSTYANSGHPYLFRFIGWTKSFRSSISDIS